MSRGRGGQWGFSNLDEYATKTSQYAIIDWYNLKTDGSPLLLKVGDLSLEVPTTPNIPTISINTEQDDVMLKLDWNAIGLVLECTKNLEESDTDSKSQNEAIRFRTAEGGLKTYSELFKDMGNHSNTLSLGNIWLIRHARFKQPPHEGDFTSIIIGGKEFSLTDGEYLGDYTE